MDKNDLIKHINNVELLNEESLPQIKQLLSKYPYFQTAHLLLAKNLYISDKNKFDEVLASTSALCADRRRLFYLINNKKYESFIKSAQKQKEDQSDRTEEVLDSYLATYSNRESVENEQYAEDSIISTDYLAYIQESQFKDVLDSEDNETPKELKHQDIIDRFLEKAETNEIGLQPYSNENKKVPKPEVNPPGGSFLTETLAKIYIKQNKYEQALTIIQQLSLNFPKKSAYFADQIRFLELLILNEKNKK